MNSMPWCSQPRIRWSLGSPAQEGGRGMVVFCRWFGVNSLQKHASLHKPDVHASIINEYIPYHTRPCRTILSPITNCRLPITNCRLPITDCQIPITNVQVPISNYHVPYHTSLKLKSQFHPLVKKSQWKHCSLKHRYC